MTNRRWRQGVALIGAAVVLSSGCDRGGTATSAGAGSSTPTSGASTSAGEATGGPGTTAGAATTDSTTAGPPVSYESFDPKNFDAQPGHTNQWFPLNAGYQSVRQGAVNRGSRRLPHRRVYTVTDVIKEINGVRTVIVLDQDFDGGQLAEQALDYLAEDKQGNVWYFGSYTEAYEGGQFVNANDAWLAGVKGAKPGILMHASPRTGTPEYVQANIPGQEVAKAKIAKTGQSTCVPFKCYKDVLVIQEGGSENTYFAPGVGGIKTEPRSKSGEEETEELINLTQLTPTGLAELSAEALKLDVHARTEAKGVFGKSAAAARAG